MCYNNPEDNPIYKNANETLSLIYSFGTLHVPDAQKWCSHSSEFVHADKNCICKLLKTQTQLKKYFLRPEFVLFLYCIEIHILSQG
jgi:hypothetical protein